MKRVGRCDLTSDNHMQPMTEQSDGVVLSVDDAIAYLDAQAAHRVAQSPVGIVARYVERRQALKRKRKRLIVNRTVMGHVE